MPGADGVFNGFPHAFRAGSQNDGGDSDHFRVLVGDQVADDGLVALFLHIIEQEVGIRPVFRGEGENVQFDLQQVAEILGNDGQGLETEQSEFCAGILGHFDAAQYVIIADTDSGFCIQSGETCVGCRFWREYYAGTSDHPRIGRSRNRL